MNFSKLYRYSDRFLTVNREFRHDFKRYTGLNGIPMETLRMGDWDFMYCYRALKTFVVLSSSQIRKKVLYLMAVLLRGGWGKGRPLRKKRTLSHKRSP